MSRSPIHRHPAEIPLLVTGIIVVVIGIPLLAYFISTELGPPWIVVFLAAVASLYITRGLSNGRERAFSVQITERQFPDVHSRIVQFSQDMGLKRVPDAYVVQQGGSLNAIASKHNTRNYIRINSDIFEVGTFALGPRPRDPEALDFIIAHELGHVAALHTTYWYAFISSTIAWVPLLGSALSRAKEYTADNHGFVLAPRGVRGIVLLSGGKYLYSEIDDSQFVERAINDEGIFLWLVNALSSHPIITKRMAALRDRTRPGEIF